MRINLKYHDIEYLPLEGINKILVIGGLDNGKSTLCLKLCEKVLQKHRDIHFVDLDIGQSVLGFPCCISSKLITNINELYNKQVDYCFFIGTFYPYNAIDIVFKSVKKLNNYINDRNSIIDTTGFLGLKPEVIKFKIQKIKLLKPNIIFYINDNKIENEVLISEIDNVISDFEGKLYIIEKEKTIRVKDRHERVLKHHQIFEKLKNGKINCFPKEISSQIENLKNVHEKYGLLCGFIGVNDSCIGFGVILYITDNKLIIYNNYNENDLLISILISNIRVQINDLKIIY